MMSDIRKVSDGMSAVGKCLRNFDTLLWVRLCMGIEKYTPNRALFFVRKKYTTFSTVRILALRSVNEATISQLLLFQPSYSDLVTGHQIKVYNQHDEDVSGRHNNISYVGFNLVRNRSYAFLSLTFFKALNI
jgi:hypothetical protein